MDTMYLPDKSGAMSKRVTVQRISCIMHSSPTKYFADGPCLSGFLLVQGGLRLWLLRLEGLSRPSTDVYQIATIPASW